LAGTCDALTVEENMAMALGRGRSRWLRRAISKEHRTSFRESLRDIGLDGRLGDRIGLLSGGQRQAVSLTMATLAPSRIMLLDEHTAALDPRASEKILAQTARIVESIGLTTLMITHSMRDALAYGDRLIMLHQGRLVLDVVGDEKAKLTIPDLLDMFGRIKGAVADEDRMLLS
jgi:putative tryptophan/tyrosine transport system ATP-binding protein